MISAIRYGRDKVLEFDLSSSVEIPKDKIWIDVTSPTEQDLQTIREKFGLHPLAIEDVTQKGQRPKVEDYDSHLFTVLHLPTIVESEVVFDELYLFLGDRWLISIHSGESGVTENVEKMLRSVPSRITGDEPSILYHILIDSTVDRYFPVMDSFEDRIEELEERVTRDPSEETLEEIDQLRRQLLLIRRYLWPTREVLTSIMKGIYPVVSDQNLQHFRDVYDHLAQLTDLLDTSMHLANNLREAYHSSLMTTMNRVMKTFTAIATIILPLTLIASIYGMNFVNMPELQWEYGYISAILVMGITALLMTLYLKRKGWF